MKKYSCTIILISIFAFNSFAQQSTSFQDERAAETHSFLNRFKADGANLLQTDHLDWHQGFLEGSVSLGGNHLSFRLGRQEIKSGTGRLISGHFPAYTNI